MDPHAGQPVASAGQPLDESEAVMIMVHGRGASARSVLDLAGALDRPGFAYLAPQASSNTWYPRSFMADKDANEPELTSALRILDNLVEQAIRSVGAERLMLLGFSQGACLTAEFAVQNPASYGGVAVLSGGLIGPPGTEWDTTAGSFEDTPVFLGCSDVDSHIPKERVDESAKIFERMGADVTKRIYPGMGHLVNEDEVRVVQGIMDAVLSGGRSD